MKKRDGIALIASLLIMAAIMTLGVGSLFLTNMNLRIAENNRTQAVAQYNAEAGLEAAIVKLKKDYEAGTPKQFPATLSVPTSPGISYKNVSYTPYTTGGMRTQARAVMVGTGPNNARYQTEALLAAVAPTSSTPPSWTGLVSENVVDANGGPTLTDARLHGNGGYEIAGNTTFQTCKGATCEELKVSDSPVTAAPGMSAYECKSNGGKSELCFGGKPAKYSDKPVAIGDVGQKYLDLRNGTATNPSKFGVKSTDTLASATPLSGCTYTLYSTTAKKGKRTVVSPAKLASSYSSGSTVCVNGDADVPSGATYSNIKIIVKGDTTASGSATFDNTNLLSMDVLDLGGNVTMAAGSRLFADAEVNFGGSIAYSGTATIASGGNMNFTSKAKEIYNTQSNEVGLAVISVGDFDAQGGLKGKGNDFVNAAVQVGGEVNISGGAKVRGGISAKGRLNLKGHSDIYGDAVLTNTDLSSTELEVAAVSRR